MAQLASAPIRERILSRGWEFFSAEAYYSSDGAVRLARASKSAESLSALVSLLKPDGMVVWTDPLSGDEIRGSVGPDIPVVFAEMTPEPAEKPSGPTGYVYSDPGAVAAIAARTLLSSGWDDFAYVRNSGSTQWCRERQAAFERCIALAGRRFRFFARPDAPAGSAAAAEALGRWLSALPKPCGIFAANDVTGEEVLAACAERGIRVPEQLAVIGMDNIPYICESTSPTLSSIATDLTVEGRETADMIVKMVENRVRGCLVRTVPPLGPVRRASTGFARDRRLAAAREFIRLNAQHEGFGPRDVVREMGVSRTLADKIFRTFAGHTILDEIHDVRLSRARELLAAGKSLVFVASACGYASCDDFRRVFRRRIGVTARKWVAANRV